METTLESVLKLLALIIPICTGLAWIIKQNHRIEKGLNKIDKHKVSHKVCDQRRAECCYNNQRKGKRG